MVWHLEDSTDHGTRPFGQPLCLRATAVEGGAVLDSKPPAMKRGSATNRDGAASGASVGSGGARRRK